MCGIIGIVGKQPVTERLMDSLKRLEYRGYDSAGVATLVGGKIERRRAQGKIRALEDRLLNEPLSGTIGIGHTRWATHGAPSERNAHPHTSGRVTLVHNGIIENFAELKGELTAQGHSFESDTDTEVIAHLIDRQLSRGDSPVTALKNTLDQITGAFALAVLIAGEDNMIMGARRGSPLVVGYGVGEMFIGSDALAVGPFTNRIAYLDEGDFVVIDHDRAQIFDATGMAVDRPIKIVSAAAALVEKGNYRHFMEKEIHEQPESCQRTLGAYTDALTSRTIPTPGLDFASVERIQIVACGTASYAAQIARYLFERLAGLPTDVEIASEFRYRDPALLTTTLAVAVSQSGETADTLAALRWCKAAGLRTAALVNSHESTMAREADFLWPTHAGPEIGVASTKAFTAQITALTALAVTAAVQRGRIDASQEAKLVKILLEAPRLIAASLKTEEAVRALAIDTAKARDVLYLGRGPMYPLAMEGALKLKEISYIHAEAYPAGELKHGPLALVTSAMPVVTVAPNDSLLEKLKSNLQEVRARGGVLYVLADADTKIENGEGLHVIRMPEHYGALSPLLHVVPLQLLAYHTACARGTDVDKPRNLAKSVTVE